ncbi:GntR family transcriptional regulator [Roseibacterium sp. SDUM158017]|uniref:GntR family transcriptional regulator n=1 Tax=Roseicyclus salinarum TaxID=3036773 RepID=UPI0024159181|nr:GntR family transcriptional regulator [Roseibacterium sp. SDUM158017]MDG4647613.1 GntR family transcriptional regulator [Roseibacterium sp. SDUM158017]
MSATLPKPHPGALPAYLRIAERLTIEIGAGRLSPGDRLPPERRMADAHGVSVMTLRKALAVVADRGLIERRQGSGNYVREGGRNVGTYAFFRLEAVPDGGGLPTARLIGLDHLPKPAGRTLGSDASHAWRIRRLRALDGVDVALEEIWLDGRFGALRADQLSESLYKSYAERLDLTIARAEDRVGSGALPDWTPEAFHLPPGHVTGLVERQSFDQNRRLAETSRTWFDTGRARYFASVP